MRRVAVATAALAAAVALLALGSGAAAAPRQPPAGLPAGFVEVASGPDGGGVWSGSIPNTFVHDTRPSGVYLPPGYSPTRRYPVVYLLHGMPGAPSSFWDSLQLATVADGMIQAGRAAPFIAVMPVGGPTVDPGAGEWAGPWESYLVDDVVPWTDRHLPTLRTPSARALAGLSSGAFGAIDIGLRHPGLFGTLESWDGYFAPVFHDGAFAGMSRAGLLRHTPSLLVRTEAAALRRERARFFLAVGDTDHGVVKRVWTLDFARELRGLGLPRTLLLLSPAQARHPWRSMFDPGLLFAARGLASS
jgi:hypothetical protein